MKHHSNHTLYTQAIFRGNRLCFGVALTLICTGTIWNLIVSYLLGHILDIMTTGNLTQLAHTTLFCLGLSVVIFLSQLAMCRAKSRFIHRGLAQYKDLAFSQLSQKSIRAFSQENTGRYLSALTNDTNSIEENYLNQSFFLVSEVLLFFGSLGMMLWYSWKLALAAILLSFLPIAVTLATGNKLAAREKKVSQENEGYVSMLKDLLGGFSVIKSFKAEQQVLSRFEQANHQVEHTKEGRRWFSCLITASATSLGFLVQFGIFLFGAYLAISGEITAGTVLIMVNLCGLLLQPIQTVPQYWASRKAALALMDKLTELTEQNQQEDGVSIPATLSQAITLNHVSFGYEPDKPVLDDVSMSFQAGKAYAIVGGSGSGKSTLLHLLMGASGAYTGSIAIDGTELREVDAHSLYDLMSLMGQDVFLFDDTIRNNLTMFRSFPQEEIAGAVERSGLSQLVEQRGEDYLCGENGVNLSGGEGQRISIARCLLRKTPVLLLDEATAALDNATAAAVTQSILNLEDTTRIVVTHRLETNLMAQYDEILVLRDGRIQEQGSFAQLMDAKGYFYSLFTLSQPAS
ncbi:ABC transporter ATP-binding protein [Pseudoflavonifractor capillosus]|uniref:ABC transporter ATP-binding protein n=1 Tax=Pseudoflavonifractor capillosus TaxID=106588 RepID=UPI0019573B6F|nr:ABC transporter ATP-binding protein [Pseudoflavonifractor capillosus]MBM6895951.1 ABC transporter ATP-binding protein [Pseudoflavonifractor capillosus]